MKQTILLAGFLAAISLLVVAADNSGTNAVDGKNNGTTLSPDIAQPRTVVVKNKDGKGIQNVKIIVDYFSARNPPQFVSNADGRAEIQVKDGFIALRVDAGGGGGIQMTIWHTEVEWPCEIILPTRKTIFK